MKLLVYLKDATAYSLSLKISSSEDDKLKYLHAFSFEGLIFAFWISCFPKATASSFSRMISASKAQWLSV